MAPRVGTVSDQWATNFITFNPSFMLQQLQPEAVSTIMGFNKLW